MTDSRTLLADYAYKGSEAAFRDLVSRYLDLVYSAAVRLTGGDRHQAEDVAQIVFADLARMARALPAEVTLGGWLHRRTCHVAATILRGNRRREYRERQAANMNAQPDHSEANIARISPVLDDAINQLGADDRMAILLRFFEHKDFRAIGFAMGSNEDAAQKRVSRALEKLQSHLKHHGVSLAAIVIAAALADGVVTAAPVGLAMAISGAALAGAAGASGTTLNLFKLITMSKFKLAILSAIVAAVVATPLIIQYQSLAKLRIENAALRQKAGENVQLAAENQQLSQQMEAAKTSGSLAGDEHAELMRLRREIGTLHGQKQDLARGRNAPAPAGNIGPVSHDSNPVASRPETQLDRVLDAPTIPLVAAGSWTNAGTATLEAAWQTFRWALKNNDTGALAHTMGWEPDVQAKAQALFEAAPAAAQQQFSSVDGAVYAFMNSMKAESFGVVSQEVQGDEGTLTVQEQGADGRVLQNRIQMHLFSDGWRAMIPSQMLGAIAGYLNTPALWPLPAQ